MITQRFAGRGRQRPERRGQGLIEFALVLPLLLLLLLGIIEAGRLLVIYTSVSSAAKQAARYGSVGGDRIPDNNASDPFYMDCAGMRQAARRAGVLSGLQDSQVDILYDRGTVTQTIGSCVGDTPVLSETIENGYRVVISVTTTYRPLVPVVPIPPLPMTFQSARAIFKSIIGPTPTPLPNPDLIITKRDYPDPVLPRNTVTYTINVRNVGVQVARDVVLTDTLPYDMELPAFSHGGWDCEFVRPVLTCGLAFLGSGNVADPIVLTVTAPYTSGWYYNVASVFHQDPDLTPANNVVTETTYVDTAIDLEVIASDTPDPAAASDFFTYTLSLRNNGSIFAGGSHGPYAIFVKPPPQASYQSFASDGSWGCTVVAGGQRCTRNFQLDVGQTTPPVLLRYGAPNPARTPIDGQITGYITATSDYGDPYLFNSHNLPITTTITTLVDLEMGKRGPTLVRAGEEFIYALGVFNRGPSSVEGLQITDNVADPNITDIVRVEAPAPWTCAQDGRTITCKYNGIVPSLTNTPEVLVYVRTNGAVAEDYTLSNTASASSPQGELDPPDNTKTETTPVRVCRPGVVDTGTSVLMASGLMNSTPVGSPADGVSPITVTVTLRDHCGDMVTTSQTVTLNSSRGAVDTIGIAPGWANPTTTGQQMFWVTSRTPSYPGIVRFGAVANSTTLTSTVDAQFYGCAEVLPRPVLGGTPRYLSFSVNNNSGMTRRLIGVELDRPNANGTVTTVKLDNRTLWNAGSGADPFLLDPNGWRPGSEGDRTVANGVNGLVLEFNFDFFVQGTGEYRLSTTWDDGAGGSVCIAPIPPLSVRP